MKKLLLIDKLLVFIPESLEGFTITKKESTNIDYIGTHQKEKILYVQFKSNKGYLYYNVSLQHLKEITTAPSAGSYFSGMIKPNYEGVPVSWTITTPTMNELLEAYEGARN